MAKSLNQVIGAEILSGYIQDTIGGVPENILPAGFLAVDDRVMGVNTSYTRYTSTRQTARLTDYGAPSQKVDLVAVADVPVKLMHFFEHQSHSPQVLTALRAEEGSGLQKWGLQQIKRQAIEFGRRFTNTRLASVYSMLANGAIYWDGSGNLLPSSSSAIVTVDYQVPSGNKDQLNVFNEGNLLTASWATDGTDIIGAVNNIKDAALKLTGYPLKYAFYGKNVVNDILTNTVLKDLITNNASLNAQALANGGIPSPLLDLTWIPVSGAFYQDQDNSYQTFFAADTVVFTPEPTLDWVGVIEGAMPLPSNTGLMYKDVGTAVETIDTVYGMFSYARQINDPPTIKQYGGDTFLPVLKVPKAIFIADVEFS